jgi:tRNA-splicing ligase RtcB
MKAGDAEFGVLCADHHPGYSQPIGGAVAYEGYVSPSGVGYDIGCLAAGTRVALANGRSVPIEEVRPSDPVLCWDGRCVRIAFPVHGSIPRGRRQTMRVRLQNGRTIQLTPDHELRTRRGWTRAESLRPRDHVACSPFLGRPGPADRGALKLPEPRTPSGRVHGGSRVERLLAKGLWPLRLEDPRVPALVRLLAYNCGDGNLSPDGKRAEWWTAVSTDAAAIAADIEVLGFRPRLRRRARPGDKEELHVYVGSVELHALFEAMGAPVGRKRWPERQLAWLFDAPDWLRAQFLSSLASAKATEPRLVDGRIANLQIKQGGRDSLNEAAFIARLLRSLGFRAGPPRPSDPRSNGRQTSVVQLLGGEEGQLRFFEQIGFCYAIDKRVASAAVTSVAWQRAAAVARRRSGWEEARSKRSARAAHWREEVAHIAARHQVPEHFVFRSWFDLERGAPRRANGVRLEPDHSNEIVWVPVASVEAAGECEVYDVVTADAAQCFTAAGLVVHNCGNKAVLTDVTRADLDSGPGVEEVMKEIGRRVSFGLGVSAQEEVEHPVLDKIRRAPFEPQRKLHDTARKQLGTVGSGNHFVNLFEDEQGRVWIGVHFGSRGFGHKTATGFLSLAQGGPFEGRVREGGMDSPPVLLSVETQLGQAYIEAMNLAGEYAFAGRDFVVERVLEILGARSLHEVHNNHNLAWRERHHGREMWVVRKGCTPAWPGQQGFVGGTMGDESVILEGVETPATEEALSSTIHGAGRVMSRSQAAGRVRRRTAYECSERDCDFAIPARAYRGQRCPRHPKRKMRKVRTEQQVRAGRVDWPAVRKEMRRRGIVLIGGGPDEAPEVYKRLPEVLAAHGDTIRVKHRLQPIGVAMAGRDVFDPYKD